MTDILSQLNWRYATKQFDPTKKLSSAQVHLVEESLRLAPSSYNLQAWKFIHVSHVPTRQLLRQAAYDQPQLTDSDQLYVVAVPTDYSPSHLDPIVNLTAQVRGVTPESLTGYVDMLTQLLSSKSPPEITDWLKRQAYIALGQAITVCAAEGIDTCPLEGFEVPQFNQILGLNDLHLTSVVALAVGFRLASDPTAIKPKVRFPHQHIFLDR